MRILILGQQGSDWVDEVRKMLAAWSKRFRSSLYSRDVEDLVQEVILDIVSEPHRRSSSLRDVLDKGDKRLAAWALAHARSKAMMRKRKELKALRSPVPRGASDWPPWEENNTAIAGRVSHALSRVLGSRESLEMLRHRSAHRVSCDAESCDDGMAAAWLADLLDRRGLCVRSVPLQSLDGLLLVADKKRSCILVSDALSDREKQFVILHEFAHFVLHRSSLDDSRVLLDESNNVPQSNAHWQREIEADLFALCVLKLVDCVVLRKGLPSIRGVPFAYNRQPWSFEAIGGIATT